MHFDCALVELFLTSCCSVYNFHVFKISSEMASNVAMADSDEDLYSAGYGDVSEGRFPNFQGGVTLAVVNFCKFCTRP